MSTRARQLWIVAQIPLRPTDRVLELGCGHGLATTAICDRLHGGTYHGIDRSPTMVAMATNRNRHHVAEDRARFQVSTVADAVLDGYYDWVIAIHFPPIERGDPTTELAVIQPHMQDTGRVAVGFQPVDVSAISVTIRHVSSVLTACGYVIHDITHGSPHKRRAAVIVAGRAQRPTPDRSSD